MNEDKLEGRDNKNLSPEAPLKPSLSSKEEQSFDFRLLTPSEYDSMMQEGRDQIRKLMKGYEHLIVGDPRP